MENKVIDDLIDFMMFYFSVETVATEDEVKKFILTFGPDIKKVGRACLLMDKGYSLDVARYKISKGDY